MKSRSPQLHSLAFAMMTCCSLALSGCSFERLFPRHPNSYDIEGENVSIRTLTLTDLCNDKEQPGLIQDYEAVFKDKDRNDDVVLYGWDEPEPEKKVRLELAAGIPGGGAAASAAGQLVADYIRNQLEEEATRYKAQFGRKIAGSKFWKPDDDITTDTRNGVTRYTRKFRQNVYAIAFERTTDFSERQLLEPRPSGGPKGMCPEGLMERTDPPLFPAQDDDDRIGGLSVDTPAKWPAFKLILGIHIPPDSQNGVMEIAPIYFVTNRSKAKVFDPNRLCPVSGDLPLRLLSQLYGRLFRTTGHQIESTTHVDLDAIWIDGKVQEAHTISLLPDSYEIEFKKYDLNKPITFRGAPAGRYEKQIKKKIIGWMPGVPVSVTASGRPVGDGAFWVKFKTTEKDPSNIQELLQKGSEAIKKEGGRGFSQ